MARTPRLLRTVRMFVDAEHCGSRCLVSQVIVYVVQYTDGTCDAVIRDATDPSRQICRHNVNTEDLTAFLQFAEALNTLPIRHEQEV